MGRFTCNQTGFQMLFSNGIRISVQFGKGNYCDNRYKPARSGQTIFNATTAEIAIMPADDASSAEYFNFGCDQVKGWVSTDEVANWISIVSSYPSWDELIKRQELILHTMNMMHREEE